jgi:flagellum-specific peptidoglycan hydrolase FlgJ
MIKMIESLTKIINVELPTVENTKKTLNEQQSFSSTSSAGSMPEEDTRKSWADKAEEESKEPKNGSDQLNVVVDPINEQLGKKVSVIFDGPMKGIYSNLAIASLHINGKNVRHKAYPTMEEAKEAYKGFLQRNDHCQRYWSTTKNGIKKE